MRDEKQKIARVELGSITSRCFGKWARAHPPKRGEARGPERAAEIEPSVERNIEEPATYKAGLG